ncbi:GNAT family N-acetyltransferase [Pseudoalteromonas sp. JBTF-M23]|uniref:GNAT family N-acetyltransferase n=1 Tax=Pseudoalteromonas caenipelagi TaxID=2726988 RepID=A0A849VI61_9GAMM|nr:GNAT family N-acetyltransferase [Pseudoalteromonas caenipelagi]NOU52163.1 GNAT family N-acetyltransferase [Pseudoalteromonas caenipelagi]
MELVLATDTHIAQLMAWFNSEDQLTQWAGPNFRYPFNLDTFKADLQTDKLTSCVLQSQHGVLQAFGQFYMRFGRCHLARLVVNPSQRGKGVSKILLSELCKQGLQSLNVAQYGLFVYEDNQSAMYAYEKFGFVIHPNPEHEVSEHCVYMVKPN